VRMGRLARLPLYPAWIGTRDIYHQPEDFPSLSGFNHLIAVYISEGDTVFLDATGKYQPFGLPTPMIQGKTALIGINETTHILARVPWTDVTRSAVHDSISVKLSGRGSLEGSGFYITSGHCRSR